MKVLDHEPWAWLLLEDDGVFYLDVHCSHSFVDYSVLIALNNEETAAFASQGRDYLTTLAYAIHYGAPGVIGSKSPYKSRNLSVSSGPEYRSANKAMTDWIAARPVP